MIQRLHEGKENDSLSKDTSIFSSLEHLPCGFTHIGYPEMEKASLQEPSPQKPARSYITPQVWQGQNAQNHL